MENILVTGGSGLVGSHLKRYLPDASYISSSDFDLTREKDVQRLFETKWDRVIHLAGRVGGILENIRHPGEFIEENLLMNTLLVKYARLSGVPRLTAVLSTCIYPDVCGRYPMTEEDLNQGPPQETNFAYAISKIAMAAQIDAYNKQYSTRYNYLIPSNLYGEHDRIDFEKSHFLTALLGKILNAEKEGGGTVKLLGSGEPLRQFLHADDLCRVIRDSVAKDITESFNVAPDENLSIREIAEIAVGVCTGGSLAIEFDRESPDGQFRKDVSNERMKEVLGEFAFTPLREGIARVYAHYREQDAI
ncbi:MAG: NAD-dependent epimerase/dehydratase family protein [Acidobacteriota bacterium]|nr:MAG: NAD-dependent epimerase/dehydratase family protein [Acidobacteriota bacterium]